MKFQVGHFYVVKFLDHIFWESRKVNTISLHPMLMACGFYRGGDEKYILLESLGRVPSEDPALYDDRNQNMQILKSAIVSAEEYTPKNKRKNS